MVLRTISLGCGVRASLMLFYRYYINKVKDVYKQATLDLMLGNSTKEDWSELRNPKADEIGEEAG